MGDRYNYNELKQEVLKEEHQLLFVTILYSVVTKLKNAGAIKLEESIKVNTYCEGSSNNWLRVAMVDRLNEMGILEEVPTPSEWPAQNRVFIEGKNMDRIPICDILENKKGD